MGFIFPPEYEGGELETYRGYNWSAGMGFLYPNQGPVGVRLDVRVHRYVVSAEALVGDGQPWDLTLSGVRAATNLGVFLAF